MAIWLSTSAALAQVTVFAAASTKTALDDVAARFTAETGKPVILSYGGSSALARQIQLGAPADLFLSANPDWMDLLQQDGLIDANSRVDLLTNELVLVAHGADAPQLDLATTDLAQLLGERWLAMALVDAVPAGIYGKTALTSLGQWADLSPRVAQSANVRAALALVATGEAAFGVVYATDAAAEEAVSVVASFPEDSHAPIVYPLAMVATSTNSSAPDFLAYLKHDDSKKIFVRHGFGVAGK
jgi:molybdate transport system substrate-binding protein